MVEAGEEMRKIAREPDVDQDRAFRPDHEIGIGRAVLEADLIDIGCGRDQRAGLGIE
jgi:hypothetical protein